MAESTPELIRFVLDGVEVEVEPVGSLLDALRESLGVTSAKDGCSPQGQCGCCTVWVDGQPRVSCVTPVARVRGRSVTTVDGLPDSAAWAASFCRNGASQCGFCTPGILMRAAALPEEKRASPDAVKQALLAHMCRCTGWNPIVDAVVGFEPGDPTCDLATDAARRAELEGGVPQTVGIDVALGRGSFADDTAPADALVAVRGADGDWVVGETLGEARAASGKIQGRRTTSPLTWPLELPDGDWVRTLRTTWVEPAYLEPDASWCAPGGQAASARGNGGAFGGKADEALGAVARRLADRHGRAVRVLATREDVVRFGPKRPPIAAGVRADGTGVVRAARTPGLAEAVAAIAPGLRVEEVDIAGPTTSIALRGAGWAEAAVLLASLGGGDRFTVTSPSGAAAAASIDPDGTVRVEVGCGRVLDATVLRSYCTGAAHMALGWVTSEGLSVGVDGVPHDLTIRSFGVLRAVDTPPIVVELIDSDAEPVNGSDAVFAAVAAAAWRRSGWCEVWPTPG